MTSIAQRLADLGLTIPDAAAPLGAYVGWVRTGNLVFTAGQGPLVDGKLVSTGKLGVDVSIEQGYEAARVTAINVLAQLKAAVAGDWDRVVRCVKLVGFVNSAPNFTDQPKVINGASELIVAVLGDAGRHARSAVGTASLPLGMSVEVEGVFVVR